MSVNKFAAMHGWRKIIVILLLLIKGIGALTGGVLLMKEPDGRLLQLSLKPLINTPFHNYFIPGFVLFVINGLLSLWTLKAFRKNSTFVSRWVLLQGILLTSWIVIQILLLQTFMTIQGVFLVIGLVLIYLSFGLGQKKIAV
jgi:hypothetical protein